MILCDIASRSSRERISTPVAVFAWLVALRRPLPVVAVALRALDARFGDTGTDGDDDDETRPVASLAFPIPDSFPISLLVSLMTALVSKPASSSRCLLSFAAWRALFSLRCAMALALDALLVAHADDNY